MSDEMASAIVSTEITLQSILAILINNLVVSVIMMFQLILSPLVHYPLLHKKFLRHLYSRSSTKLSMRGARQFDC